MVTTKTFMGLLIGMVLVSVIAQGADTCCDQSEVKTLGMGQVSVPADMATIYVSIMTDGATVVEATNNSEIMLSKIYDALSQP